MRSSAGGRSGRARRSAGETRSAAGGRSREGRRPTGEARPTASGRPSAGTGRPRPSSGSRQAAQGTARSARTVTTQEGHPSRSGPRRRPAAARRGRGTTAGSAARSGAGAPGRPSGSRLRRAAASIPPRPRYWLRWLLVIAIALTIVAALAYTMIASAAWVRGTIRSQDDAEAASQVRTVYPAPATCDDAHLRIAMDAPEETSVGAGMSIGITLTNESDDACLLDVGGASLGAVISSGDQTVWDSTTCPAEPTERPLLVDAGESADASLRWSGASAQAGCSPPAPSPSPSPTRSPTPSATPEASASPEAGATTTPSPVDPSVAAAGTYRIHLRLGGTDVTGEQVFVIK